MRLLAYKIVWFLLRGKTLIVLPNSRFPALHHTNALGVVYNNSNTQYYIIHNSYLYTSTVYITLVEKYTS